MSTKALENKANEKPKFRSRAYTRCQICGRARAVYRKFMICRICFRKMANEGIIPGVRKASW
ncbi:MAG: type Z 30S ribosomal protein S14 [Planctomycetaceae bacterium]|nr:type Z 30S ribosomal protein S14 [Planctomycetaceae bacterium]